MKELKKEFNKVWWGSVVSSILFIIVGILLMIEPAAVITAISMIVGIAIIIAGIFAFLKYFRNTDVRDIFKFDLIYGVICVLAGSLLIVNPKAVASILPLVLGIWMIINSIIKMQYAFSLKEYKSDGWIATLIIAVITLGLGILFIFNPFKGATLLMQIIGGVITLYAVMDIVNSYILKKNVKNVSDYVNESVNDLRDALTENLEDDIPDAVIEEVKPKPKKKNKTTNK
ncbi:MAG: DUF308 domain-containing protein [Bacilli bacterium]